MDMIEQIELEDAVKLYSKVYKRIYDVALIVGNIDGTLNIDRERVDWRVDRWHFDIKSNKVNVAFSCSWEDRPETIKFGIPDGDYEDDYARTRLERFVTFPVDYLYRNDWVNECVEKNRAETRRMNAFKAKNLERHIEKESANLDNMKKELERLRSTLTYFQNEYISSPSNGDALHEVY